jgi:beta-1,4-mannosyltransferase
MDWVQPIDKLVAFRIVSRGTNIGALLATIRRCQSEMAKTPLSPT